jgi:hypothetical protein
MSALKSGALLSLFSGVSLGDIQRAAARRDVTRFASYPSAEDVAHATRFAGPAQVSIEAARKVAEDTIAEELSRIRPAA